MELSKKTKSTLETIVITVAAIMMASPLIIFAILKILGEK